MGLSVSASACGRCHACACVFVLRMCVRVAGVYFTQVCFKNQRTHLRTHSLQVVHICVYVCMCVYACICIWMRMCVYDIA